MASLPINSPEKRHWLLESSAQEIQGFIHASYANYVNGYGREEYELARTALDVRIAEDAERLAVRFEQQMIRLTGMAEEQKVLAERLDRQTSKLIYLTYALVVLTLLLLFFTVYLSYDTYLKSRSTESPKPHAMTPNNRVERTATSRLVFDAAGNMSADFQSQSARSVAVAHSCR